MSAFDEEFWGSVERRAERILSLRVGDLPPSDEVQRDGPAFDEEFWGSVERRAERILSLRVGDLPPSDKVYLGHSARGVATAEQERIPALGHPGVARRRRRTDEASTRVGSRDKSLVPAGAAQRALADETEWLATWLEEHRPELNRNVARRVRRWISEAGGHIDANDPELQREADSAVALTCVLMRDQGQDFSHSTPVQIRSFVVLTASGFVLPSLRQYWEVPVDDVVLAATPAPSFGEADGDMWLLRLARGRLARPLVDALRLYARGAELAEIAAAVRACGLEISDGQVAVELLRVLRFAKKGDPELAPFLADAQTRLRPALVQHLISWGLRNERLLEVVADRATGVTESVTARHLQVTTGRVRTLRHEARKHDFVRECLEDDRAFGWALAI